MRSIFTCESDEEYYGQFSSSCCEPEIIYCASCGDAEVLVDGETCSDCLRDAQHDADEAQAAAMARPAFREMRMTARGGFVKGRDGQWWQVRS